MAKTLSFFLVDDDTDDTSLFKEVLQEVNPSIIFNSAEDGQQALQFLKSSHDKLPDVIFLDLNMPRMSGKECLTEIKNDEKLHKIPVIMYTTSSQSKDIEETMQKGAICFITKPTNIKELKNILASVAGSVHNNLEKTLRVLSNNINTFMVC
ncbi:MAG TPA: response regulator [Parafilimonas sp.]|nr:response regulator [Parafilimonas sp.]